MSDITEKMLKIELKDVLEWGAHWLDTFIIPIYKQIGDKTYLGLIEGKKEAFELRKDELEKELKNGEQGED